MPKAPRSKQTRVCANCGRKAEGRDRFCAGCGSPLGPPHEVRAAPSTLLPGLLVLVFFLTTGFGLWMHVVSSTRPNLPPPPSEAAAPALPEGHPPIGLPPQAKEALAKLEKEAQEAPSDLARWRQLAGMQYQASRFDPAYSAKAEVSYQKILALAPGDAEALANLGNLHYDRREYAEAANYYEQFLKREGSNPSIETDLATSYLYQGKLEKAIKSYQKVVSAHPEFAKAHFNLGIAYRAAGQKNEAIESLKRARDLSTDPGIKQRISSLVDQILADGKATPPPGQASDSKGTS